MPAHLSKECVQQQSELFDEVEEGKQIRLLEKLPYDFHYRYECDVDGQTIAYRHKLVDWEIGALFRNVQRKHGDNWEAAFRAKLEQDLPSKDLLFLLGTIHRFPNQWLLVSVAGAACDATCARYLYLQRQLREGLGKEKERLDWVWLIDDDAPVAIELLPALKTATVLRVPAKDLANWLEPSRGAQLHDHLFVVDPMGNWMMRFPAQLDAAHAPQVERDLERLLRASASWDNPGR